MGVQAYGHHRDELQREPLLVDAANALGAPSVGLLSMRWALQLGAAIIPRSRKLSYVTANKRVFDFVLPQAAVEALGAAANVNTSLFGLHDAFRLDMIQ